MAEKLDARIETLQTELFGHVPGWRARRLSTAELYELCVEFWGNEPVDRPVRTRTTLCHSHGLVSPRVVRTER